MTLAMRGNGCTLRELKNGWHGIRKTTGTRGLARYIQATFSQYYKFRQKREKS
jgi:hypothetical protein